MMDVEKAKRLVTRVCHYEADFELAYNANVAAAATLAQAIEQLTAAKKELTLVLADSLDLSVLMPPPALPDLPSADPAFRRGMELDKRAIQ